MDCVIAIVGGGPAGLMAAEVLAGRGWQVDLLDAMPSVGRKFLLAGKGGLNLTHDEDFEPFVERYGAARDWLQPRLQHFGAAQLRTWAGGLGVETFVGSSGRVFPREMKAAPLLRRWLQRLRAQGVRIHTRHRLLGFAARSAPGTATADPATGVSGASRPHPPMLRIAAPQGELHVRAEAVLLALGGASWPALGSDGAWLPWLQAAGVAVAALRPANCGFDVVRAAPDGGLVPGWSEHFRTRFAGAPLKGVELRWTRPDGQPAAQVGEFVITAGGVEGSLVYAASAGIRETITRGHQAIVALDLLPQRSAEWVSRALSRPRGSKSLSSHLKSRLGLTGLRVALVHELLPRELTQDPARLAAALKALPLRLGAPRPLAEAISTAGGVRLAAVDEGLMLSDLPGVFCAGEMLDWEAPTGGYLLTACFATGVAAAEGIAAFLAGGSVAPGSGRPLPHTSRHHGFVNPRKDLVSRQGKR
ncbi:MAG: TIGR03862 family flavoprotein [Gammaproteobacteria bacterium]|nr:TIGR03862 family flavoprotein [Gammaproteobacteria bacterium]